MYKYGNEKYKNSMSKETEATQENHNCAFSQKPFKVQFFPSLIVK